MAEDGGEVTPDNSEAAESPARTGRWRIWFYGIAAVLVLLGADAVWRNVEFDRVLDGVERAEPAMDCFNSELYSEFGNTGLSETVVFRDQRTGEIIDPRFGELAARQSSNLAAAREIVSDLFVAPWRKSVRDARREYLAHIDAWLVYLRDVSTDPDTIWEERPEIAATFVSAERAVRRAVPTPALGRFQFRSRVDRLFENHERRKDEWCVAGPEAELSDPLPGPRGLLGLLFPVRERGGN